jgi:sporulation-control protein
MVETSVRHPLNLSMLKRLLARVGIGSAQVDTTLGNASLIPGELLEGEVHIVGGDIAQEVDDIYLKVATVYQREVDDSTIQEECVLVNYHLLERFQIQSKQEMLVPFSFQLPYETPLTLGQHPVYIRTGLDIKIAIDPGDCDSLEVRPHPLMQAVLQGLKELGFNLYRTTCQYTRHFNGSFPFVQELEFRPTGLYRDRIDELGVIFRLHPDELEVFVEIDRRTRGLGGFFADALDLDERYVQFCVTPADRSEVAARLAAILDN